MGAELLAGAQVGLGVFQGISAAASKMSEGAQLEAEGVRAEGEHRREASRIRDDGKRFAASQKMMYLGSGVEIGGSAVVTLAQTDKWAEQEAQSVRDRGSAARDYYKRRGQISRNEGMGAFIQGIGSGLGKAVSTYAYAEAYSGGK